MIETGILNFSPELHLGSKELTAMMDMVHKSISSVKGEFTKRYGVVRNRLIDYNFNNFMVTAGVDPTTIVVPVGSSAYDSLGRRINMRAQATLEIPNNATKYVVVSYLESKTEVGTISLSAQGVITGTGTKFTERLRGQERLPVKILLRSMAGNDIGEYLVSSVTSDTVATLVGTSFTAQEGVTYVVVGTFTPSITIPTESKYPYRYDDCLITLSDALVQSDGSSFTVAKAINTAGVVTVQDYRSVSGYGYVGITPPSYTPANILGIDGVRFSETTSAKSASQILVGFGLRVATYTVGTSGNTIVLNSIEETGRIHQLSDVVTDLLNGCRVYRKDGGFDYVISTTNVGGVVTLTLDSLNPTLYDGTTLAIAPDCQGIVFMASVSGSEYRYNVTVHPSKLIAIIPVEIGVSSSTIKVEAVIIEEDGTVSEPITPSDDAVGYYDESSYETTGALKSAGRTRVPYEPSETEYFITALENPSSLRLVIRGNASGVNVISNLEALAVASPSRHIPLTVGVSKEKQLIKSDGSQPLTDDTYFNLLTTGAFDGAHFEIEIDDQIVLGQRPTVGGDASISFLVDGLSSGITVELNNPEAMVGKVVFDCKYDSNLSTGNKWVVSKRNIGYDGSNSFVQNALGVVVIDDATFATVITSIGGRNVLNIDGAWNSVLVWDKRTGTSPLLEISYVATTNKRPIVELYLSFMSTRTPNFVSGANVVRLKNNYGNGTNDSLFGLASSFYDPNIASGGVFKNLSLYSNSITHMSLRFNNSESKMRQSYMIASEFGVPSVLTSVDSTATDSYENGDNYNLFPTGVFIPSHKILVHFEASVKALGSSGSVAFGIELADELGNTVTDSGYVPVFLMDTVNIGTVGDSQIVSATRIITIADVILGYLPDVYSVGMSMKIAIHTVTSGTIQVGNVKLHATRLNS